MNTKRKSIAILLILIFLASTIPVACADDVNYDLDEGVIDLIVHENGLLHVKEAITYHFDSSANGVYRDIPLKENQTIENLKVTVDGAYCDYKIIESDSNQRIKVYLYSDKAKTHKISSGTDITVHYEYDMTHVVKIYKDTGELHYKLWGEEWDTFVGMVKATVHFPNKKGIEYWINPYDQVTEDEWSGNTLMVESGGIPSGEFLELRSAIPLSEFKNPTYAQHINENGLEKIKKTQEDYENANNFANVGFLILSILGIISFIIPIIIYFKEGREPKIDYQGIYEREPPTKDSPAFVNAMQGGFNSTIGEPDTKGFQATIMDLINRKVISISRKEDGHKNTALMAIDYNNLDGLEPFERRVLNILKPFEINGEIDLDKMNSSLKGKSLAENFSRDVNAWERDFKSTYLPGNELKKYFIDTGSTYMKIYGLLIIIYAIAVGYFSMNSIVPNALFAIISAVLMFIVGVICLKIPSTIGGRWTKYGKEYDAKWNNFKKFLKDYSLIKEHPPESIAIWNEYLVYATALGVADEVYKAMKMHVYSDNDSYYNNHLFMFYYFGGYRTLNHAINTGISTARSNNSVGGIGGGSGGGGGGAF